MGQITIYLDADTEKRLATVIKNGGISKSRWIADLIKEKVATRWPDDIAALAGAWSDLPTTNPWWIPFGRTFPRGKPFCWSWKMTFDGKWICDPFSTTRVSWRFWRTYDITFVVEGRT